MHRAIGYANRHGGKLHRSPGGYWAEKGFDPDKHPDATYFGTNTVDGMVKRGIGTYTSHRTNSRGDFAVEFTLDKFYRVPETEKLNAS